MLRWLRRRVGVASPKLAIRQEWPLQWRVASVVVLSAIALALAGWIYDAGRQFAGYDRGESGRQLGELGVRVVDLESELAEVRRIADASVAKLQVESTAQERLALLIKTLEEENSRLKAELAVFENLAGNENAVPQLAISRFEVVRNATQGSYEYRLLAVKAGRGAEKGFKGQLELVVSVKRGADIEQVPLAGAQIGLDGVVQFKYFKRIDGRFSSPLAGEVVGVEARLSEDGQVRATQTIKLSSVI